MPLAGQKENEVKLKTMGIICIGLALALFVLGCQFDASTEVDADSIEVVDAAERIELPEPGDEGQVLDEGQVFYDPGEASATAGDIWMPGVQCGPFWSGLGSPCNTIPPNCCAGGSSCIAVNSGQWRCGYYIAKMPNGSTPVITDSSCTSAADIAARWNPGVDKKCHVDDPPGCTNGAVNPGYDNSCNSPDDICSSYLFPGPDAQCGTSDDVTP